MALSLSGKAPPSTSAFDRITGPEIDTLLSGHTAMGTWGDDRYRQFFDPSGTTFYAPKGKRTTRGKWRISDDGVSYESWWSGDDTNWEVYEVVRVKDGLAWLDPDGVFHAFVMLKGQQLVWPE